MNDAELVEELLQIAGIGGRVTLAERRVRLAMIRYLIDRLCPDPVAPASDPPN